MGVIRRLTRKEIQTNFDPKMRLQLGELIYQALPEYYEKVPLDRDCLLLLLADQVDVPLTELNETYAFWQADSLLGLLTIIDSADLKLAQTFGTVSLVRELNREGSIAFKKAFAGYGQGVEELALLEGKYLPRMAVAAAARGKGVARALMKHVLDLYPNDRFALHVAQTNAIVNHLHTSLGFKPQSNTDLPIRVLVRPPSQYI